MYSIDSVLLLTVLPDETAVNITLTVWMPARKVWTRSYFSIKKRERTRDQTRKTIFRLERREERGKWFYGLWALDSSPEWSTAVNNLVVH